MRAIDADALMEHKYITNSDGDTIGERWYVTFEEIESAPTIEPERKKGKWIWLSSTYDRVPCEMKFMCSECHHEVITHDSDPWERFCPNCGADMRGE